MNLVYYYVVTIVLGLNLLGSHKLATPPYCPAPCSLLLRSTLPLRPIHSLGPILSKFEPNSTRRSKILLLHCFFRLRWVFLGEGRSGLDVDGAGLC